MAATYPPNLENSPRKPTRRPDMARLAVRHEPGMWPAAALAVMVHIAFFTLIVFGVTWQVKSPMPLSAEIWESLPPIRNAPVPPPVEPEPAVVKPAPVEKVLPPPQPTRAEIEVKAKRERAELVKQQQQEKEIADKKKREEAKIADERKKAEDEKKRRDLETANAKAQKAAEVKMRAEQDAREAAANAARSAAINEYSTKIALLIRNRANIPDTVTGKPKVAVRLRLLVNGRVFDAQVVTPSGNRVYDEAVERAINGVMNWPLPDNPELLGANRTLTLNIEHER